MSGNCGTALGLWIKNRGEKKTLLLKRRSLSPLSSAIPGARQRLPSLPGDTTEPAPEAAVQNHGPPAPPAAEGLGDPRSGAHPPFAHPGGTRASSAQPPSWLDVLCLPPANPKGRPWDKSQPQPQGHGKASSSGRRAWGEEPGDTLVSPQPAASPAPWKDQALQPAQDSYQGLGRAPRHRAGKEPRYRGHPAAPI